MATLNQVVQSLADSVNRTTDFALKERLKFIFKNYAAERIRQDIEKNGGSMEYGIFYIEPLSKVDIADSCVLTAGCSVLRTTNKISKPVRIKGRVPFNFLGSADGKYPFTYVSREDVTDFLKLKYLGRKIYWDYINEYIYVYNNIRLKDIGIEGYYTTSEVLNCITGSNCYTDDTELPIPMDMIQSISKQIMETELRINVPSKQVTIDEDSRQ